VPAEPLEFTLGPGRAANPGGGAGDWRVALQTLGGPQLHISPDVGDGWAGILRAMLLGLDTGEREQVLTVTEHFGGLQVVTRAGAANGNRLGFLISKARERSRRTCSRCGREGSRHARGRRQETSCEDCHEHLLEVDADGRFPARQ
jgi:Zn finger protein HypA/HybF involved in hydrogenase expression